MTGKGYFPLVDTHLMASRHVEQLFNVQVMQPCMKRGETTRFPVVYATDGNLTFDMFRGMANLLQPDLRFILVGIGYPGDSPLAGSILRARDLTFPGYPKISFPPPDMEGVLVVREGAKNFHGGEEFQKFLEHELMPFIDEKYQTLPGDRAYFGHSAGGGFGLFTLFAKPDLFNRYIVSSPGLIYQGNDFLLQDARRFIASGKTLQGVNLYLSVGTEEEFEAGLEQWSLTSSFYRLAALLRAAAIPELKLTTEALAGETHATAWPMAFMHGIRAVLVD